MLEQEDELFDKATVGTIIVQLFKTFLWVFTHDKKVACWLIISKLTVVLIRTFRRFNINPIGLPGFRPLPDCVFPEQTEHESIRGQNEIKKSGKENKSDYRVNHADKKKPKAVNRTGQSRKHIAEKSNSNTGTSDSNKDVPVPCPTHTFDCKDTCPE
jgi:hypothetical protein